MSQPSDPSRDLLFGLLALQTGLIDQGPLFAAFAAWTRGKARSLADYLVELGHLDAPRRAAVEAIAGAHIQALGGDPGKSLAVLAVERSTRNKSLTGEQTFFQACCHAGLAGLAGRPGSGISAAQGPAQADEAMAVLRRAVAMGYRNPDTYRTEMALDPLRNRPDFRELMMDLVFPARPFAN